MNPVLGTTAVVVALVRARPWQALVTRLPAPWMQYLGLCGYCLGFWAGLITGLVQGQGWSAVVLGAYVSLLAGAVTGVLRLLDRAAELLEAWTSELLK